MSSDQLIPAGNVNPPLLDQFSHGKLIIGTLERYIWVYKG